MQQHADEIIWKYQIAEMLSKYGDIHLHGSYKLGLMTWPEIDIWLLSDDFQSSTAWDIIKDLASAVPPTHVHVINQFDHPLGRTPPDCISIDYRFLYEEVEWKLDICAGTYARCQGALDYLPAVIPQLTPEVRETIMKLKRLATGSRLYRKSRWNYTHGKYQFISVDIYMAVLNCGVRTPAEFASGRSGAVGWCSQPSFGNCRVTVRTRRTGFVEYPYLTERET